MGLTAYVTRDPDSKQLVLERSVDPDYLFNQLSHTLAVVLWFLVTAECVA